MTSKKYSPIQVSVLVAAIAINILVGINNFIHDPNIGYDSDAHLDYAAVLFDHLPTIKDTSEFFSPPLSYFIPSVGYKMCEVYLWGNCSFIAGRLAQLCNFLLSIGITIFLLKIAELIKPKNQYFKLSGLVILGIMTVYYKSFSQLRGETYIAFFVILSVYLFIKIYQKIEFMTWEKGIGLGIIFGAIILSRQWGVAIFPAFAFLAVLIYVKNQYLGKKFVTLIVVAFAVAFITGGWFYIYLYKTYGSFAAFNEETLPFALNNHSRSFYTDIGIRNLVLFKSPTRTIFDNRIIPILYSEVWGDYWGYFVFIRDKSAYGLAGYGNKELITPYLGRVNFVSLFPSVFLFGGVGVGVKKLFDLLRSKQSNLETVVFVLLFMIFFFSILLYFWFLVTHVVDKGATIKATYILQAFIVLPLLVSELMEKIRAESLKTYFALIGLLGLVFIHNLPAMISRYWWWLSN